MDDSRVWSNLWAVKRTRYEIENRGGTTNIRRESAKETERRWKMNVPERTSRPCTLGRLDIAIKLRRTRRLSCIRC